VGSALGIALFQLVGSIGASHNQTDRRGLTAVAVLLLLAGPAALAVRDRWPLAALAVTVAAADVYIASGYAYGPIFVSVIVAMFYAVLAGRRQGAWLFAGLGYGGYIVASLVRDDAGRRAGAVHLALVAGWLVVVLAVAEVVRVRRDQAAERSRLAEEEEQRRIGEQRLTLAQELHDVLAHKLSLINVQASVALHLIDNQPEQAAPALAHIKEASRDALHELRGALDLLRSGDAAPRTPAPRLADVDDLVDGVRASGLDVRLEQAVPPVDVPDAVERAAYRIVQEALTNATRHARASQVTVRLNYDDDLLVEVVDDGAGAAAANGNGGGGNGIIGMRERAAALGGSLDAGPLPGGGFRVLARLPVAAP
jgi:signal transduction histidine kinase